MGAKKLKASIDRIRPVDLVLSILGLLGAVFNSNLSVWGFVVWIPANIGLVVLNFRRGYYEQAVLFLFYTATSVFGMIRYLT